MFINHPFHLDYDKIKHDYVTNDGSLVSPSLNSTLLTVLRERLCTKTYTNKAQLFSDTHENNNAFIQMLLTRFNQSKVHRLPLGLSSLKSNPYLLYLLNYNEQQRSKYQLSELERYLIDMLFPHWDFLVCSEVDEHIYMILLPRTERDLLLLNTDLTLLMHDLIAHYSIEHFDQGIPIYDDCRHVMEGLMDEIESLVGTESPFAQSMNGLKENPVDEEQIGIIV